MTSYEHFRTALVPLDVLTRLIRAGLGDRPQRAITRQQYEQAMGIPFVPSPTHPVAKLGPHSRRRCDFGVLDQATRATLASGKPTLRWRRATA